MPDRQSRFHPTNERGPKRHKRIVEAKKICSQCPVRQACRDHALTGREAFGSWGGMSEEERDHVLGRGRSRQPAERPLRPAKSSGRPQPWDEQQTHPRPAKPGNRPTSAQTAVVTRSGVSRLSPPWH
ncbi:WhiB family transcriptional regulator [Rhodococcus oxybenzonivorans]|uniref:WhiB family transcriptional regulator n=1 Tax=Rhodococcus oxybenzonivorans TaxID=1990687 RepID=UPI001E3EFE22|nr:WhiB family transcriptional regulator [Rhodococcus oxybenzonivorans]